MEIIEEARDRIAKARLENSDQLDLHELGLQAFPEEILELKRLREMNLSGNQLRSIPDSIRSLPHLKNVYLYRNPIETLPDLPIWCLSGEAYLRVRNQLSARNVKGLWVTQNSSSLIEQLASFTDLGLLVIEELEIEVLPTQIGHLPKLTHLWVIGNRLREFPKVLFELNSLNRLSLPSPNGEIQEIPRDILGMKSLEHLDVEGHPIRTPPPEVVSQGVEAIKNFWRQGQEEGVDHLCEAKLIILGEGGAGKTSLANKIRNAAYELTTSEPTTEGIEVTSWSFPAMVRSQARDIRVNIWDFGGQEIYHSTHQFFLTRRSVYALVADDRKEDTDFNYWLDVIELLSGDSPVLVIQNEKQDRRREVDFGPLRARFANLREPYRVNLLTNRGLEEVVGAIRREMQQLGHIGDALPKTWKRVREALEHDERDHIPQEQYFDICQEHGFKRTEDKLQLSAYLHDLGICLHFQDDPVLQHTVILKPRWGTDAVYRALDDKGLFAGRGRFQAAELGRIWSEERYAGKRQELLRLMMKFRLCYQVPDTDTYIVPQLLPVNQPTYDWPDGANLIVRYEYDFMPKGLVTRLIASQHHRVADQDLVWRSGAIFRREDTRAEVIEDYPRRRIGIRVNGPDAHGLFAILDNELDRIHSTFPKLKLEKHIPCNCPKCENDPDPYLFPVGELREFAKEGAGIQCRRSKKLVDAGTLLRDLIPAAIWHRAEPPTVFVSYRQTDEGIRLVDQIEAVLRGHRIELLLDRNQVGYRESFRRFMERLGAGDAIVLVLSNEYFESENCLFELTEIAAHGGLRQRIYPIVLSGTKVFTAQDQARIVAHWDERVSELVAAGVLERVSEISRFRNQIGEILKTLADMNMLKAGDTFKPLVDQLEKLIAP